MYTFASMLVSIFIIAGIAVGFFLLSILLTKKHKLDADKFLILYLLFFCLSQIYFYLETLGTFQQSPWMLVGRGVFLLGGPLFFYYVYTLTTSKPVTRIFYTLTLLPFVLYVIHFLYQYYLVFPNHDIHIENGLLYIDHQLSPTWTFFVLLLVISDPLYLFWFYRLLRQYRQRIIQSVSRVDQINLNWLNVVFYLWVISIFIFVPALVFSIGRDWFSSAWIAILLQLDYLLFIFFLGLYGFRQSVVFVDKPEQIEVSKEKAAPSYERSGLSDEQADLYHARLMALMRDQHPYLDGELTASQLALQLGISVNHLSQIINQREGKNFFDFVNGYRVEEVKRKMGDSRYGHLTLLAIGLESGFNSKTSFNTVFKKLTGKTPSEYQKSTFSS